MRFVRPVRRFLPDHGAEPAMIRVSFSAPLVAVTSCTDCTSDDVETVGGLIAGLEKSHPGFRSAVLDDQSALKPHLNVYVNKHSIKLLNGLDTPLKSGDAVFFGVTVAGG